MHADRLKILPIFSQQNAIATSSKKFTSSTFKKEKNSPEQAKIERIRHRSLTNIIRKQCNKCESKALYVAWKYPVKTHDFYLFSSKNGHLYYDYEKSSFDTKNIRTEKRRKKALKKSSHSNSRYEQKCQNSPKSGKNLKFLIFPS